MSTPVPAMSVHQPWASLWALGHKHAETRPQPPAGDMRPPGVRPLPGMRLNAGDRVAIASTATVPVEVERSLRLSKRGFSGVRYQFEDVLGDYCLNGRGRGIKRPLPLGAIVGVARVIDTVPIVALPEGGSPFHVEHDRAIVVRMEGDRPVDAWHKVGPTVAEFADQLPMGIYTPGRWAILTASAFAIHPPIPVKGRQGVWPLPDDAAHALPA